MTGPRSRLVLALLLTVAAVLAAACGEKSLALNLKQGDKFTYHVVMDAKFAPTKVEGLPPSLSGAFNGGYRMEYDTSTAIEQVEGKVATVKVDVSNMTGSLDLMGVKTPMQGLPSAFAVTLKIDTDSGEVLEVTGLPELGGGMSADQLKDLFKQSFTQLPKTGRAKVGDSWTVETSTPVTAGAVTTKSSQKVTTTYAANETRDGAEVAKLVISGGGPLSVSTDQSGVKIEAQGSMQTAGTAYVDLADGQVRHTEMTVTAKMSEKVQVQGVNVSMDLDITTNITIDRK